MKIGRFFSSAVVFSLPLSLFLADPRGTPQQTQDQSRTSAQRLVQNGNWKDGYEAYAKLVLDPSCNRLQAANDLQQAIQCLRNLSRNDEVDEFREKAVELHGSNWRLLAQAAHSLIQGDSYGYIVAGKFERGGHRGGGRWVSSFERDRVRALQLLQMASDKLEGNENERFEFFQRFASTLIRHYYGGGSWRLQILTDLATLPDYEDGHHYYGGETRGAPVDTEGNPVFYKVPADWSAAKNDGERWRWCLQKGMEIGPSYRNTILYQLAHFLRDQFDVHTLAHYGWRFDAEGDEDGKTEGGIFAVDSLAENETIARLATGVKRFPLPEEFNFIRMFREGQNWTELAQIFQNRRQYDKAAECWAKAGPSYAHQLSQIRGNWGELLPTTVFPAGEGAKVQFRFRNGKKVRFTAQEIDTAKLLAEIKRYLKSNPGQLDWNNLNPEAIGYRIVQQDEDDFVRGEVAAWDLALEPRAKHFSRRIAVTTPLQKAGAYLLTATMEGGNTSRVLVWIADTVIVQKPLHEGHMFFVADAMTGRPLPKMNLEFFGYRQENAGKLNRVVGRDYHILVSQFAEFTDGNGLAFPKEKDLDPQYQWLVTASSPDGRQTHLGFLWTGKHRYYDYEYNQTKVYGITDRPVYRPAQKMQFKFWVRRAQYDQEEKSDFAGQNFAVEIYNPKNERIHEGNYLADEFGGFEGSFALAKDATLGVYRIHLPNHGGQTTFRVEEYKKPEFQVSIESPAEPVALGEKIAAKIQAKYYFGAPVAKGKIKYKVQRSEHSASWYPVGRWDWFYGKGYWWYGYDYHWYPGWRTWGCERPFPWWWWRSPQPPELVMENEVELGSDGTVSIEIDTALAKLLHGDADHSYEITAEVTDESRRTIVGSGSVLAARKPFKVYAWVDRGHYQVGDTIGAEFSAQTLDSKPVSGKGKLSLLRLRYDKDGEPQETPVQSWDLDTDAQGRAMQQIKASEPGQFRLSFKLTDSKGRTEEGGYIFVVRGPGFDGAQFRFNEIELVQDKREYQPGEKVKLLVNTNRSESFVLLFTRPANGVYLAPKLLRLSGKSALEEIEITKKDMPNFFVEAMTIANGKIHQEAKEIVVPPESRTLNVEVLASAPSYKPGEMATILLRITDAKGAAFVGATALAVYDKALEYISGGSNVPEIKSFFWKWRRQHRPMRHDNFERYFHQLLRSGELGMEALGVFGNAEEDWEENDSRLGVKDKKHSVKENRSRRGLGAPGAPSASMAGESEGMLMSKSEARDDVSAEMKNEQEKGDFRGAGDTVPPGGNDGSQVEPTVRSNFADTAFWNGSLRTNSEGIAEVRFKMPENLTGWKIRSWAMGHGTKCGEGESEVVTAKKFLLRMQAPRFFVEKDEVVLSANVHNYLEAAKLASVELEIDHDHLEAMGPLVAKIEIGANGEKRVDWRVRVRKEGETLIRMKALTDVESDAMEMRFPVFVHGMSKMLAWSRAIRPEGTSTMIEFTVPAQRRPGESRLEVRYSPTLAGAMVDALPYLVDYPYGCTEQTLSRFLPTVIVQKILLGMNLDLKAIAEKRTNLNAQEIGEDKERAKQWKRFDRNPVFETETVREMATDGLKALYSQQLSDGGWGWFSGYGEHSTPHTTAYVVHGLQTAAANGLALVPGVLENGVAWLKRYQIEQIRLLKNAMTDPRTKPYKLYADNLDAFVYMVLGDADVADPEMRDFLYRDRNHLAVYAKAMFGIALEKQKQSEMLAMILQNIGQYLVQDDENQTAYLKLGNESYWWYWYGSEYEAHAYYLKLLARTDPKGEIASRLVKYLLNNRKNASYWNSTRDTAICIEAFADYLKASGEDKPDMTVEVWLDGKKRTETKIDTSNLFTFENKFVLTGEAVTTGKHTIELRKKGTGPVYANAYFTYFSLEDFIEKAGLEVKVERRFYRLKEVEKKGQVAGSRGQVVEQREQKYEREPLALGATLKSGELVEIELEIESKNDYEYLIFEDMKAAGFEPVEVRSGYNGNDMGAYVEFRDERVCFFVRQLARGKHSVSYRLRAEIPGKFSALPTRGYAMYAPELRGNSGEFRVGVED